MVDDFFRFLASYLLSVTDSDRLRWNLTKNGNFTIRSYYRKLHGSSSITFPWKGIWKVKAPRRVSFFVWTVTWNRILTGDNLSLKGFDFVDWCIMCRCCDETVDHLLLHGVLSLGLLGFHGFPRVRCKIVCLGGGIGWGSIHLTFGI